MTVHFIGAGPGAADLITLRGRDLIARSPVCLHAGSIIPRDLLQHCPRDARIIDTAPLSLDEIEAEFVSAHAAGHDVARPPTRVSTMLCATSGTVSSHAKAAAAAAKAGTPGVSV